MEAIIHIGLAIISGSLTEKENYQNIKKRAAKERVISKGSRDRQQQQPFLADL